MHRYVDICPLLYLPSIISPIITCPQETSFLFVCTSHKTQVKQCFLSSFLLRFSLKTRWTTKADQRTVFTDSMHLFVCGLASQQCTNALVQIAKTSSRAGVQNWVKNRQALVLRLLKNLCHSNNLTGPKVDLLDLYPDLF